MGHGFKKVKVSFVGSHKNSHKISQWLRANGGQYSHEIDCSVTHLIATESDMGNNPSVEKARSLGIKIVTYEWLEDSLLSRTCKPKPEDTYSWDRILKNRDEKYKVTQKIDGTKPRKRFDIEQVLGKFQTKARPVRSNLEKRYDVYVDSIGVRYTATLVRYILVDNRSRKETFLLRIYETTKKPHTYTTVVKYSRIGLAHEWMITPGRRNPLSALSAFRTFFLVNTGVEWKDRFDDSKLHPSPEPSAHKEEQPQPPEGGWFYYERPGGLIGALNNDYQVAIEQKLQTHDGTEENNSKGRVEGSTTQLLD